jgi:DNA-directed RNA polymerase beta' subunit
MVGILGAQSIGERQTQTTLNTFHTAGKLQQNGANRFQDLINTTKNLKVKTCTLRFKKKYDTADDLREAVGSSIVSLTIRDVMTSEPTINITDDKFELIYQFNLKTMVKYRITPTHAAEKIDDEFDDCSVVANSTSLTIVFDRDVSVDDDLYLSKIKAELEKISICGIEGINDMYLDHEDGEWIIITNGSNLKKLLVHPLIDPKRLYCNNIWEVTECLGIAHARKMFLQDFKKTVGGINECHLMLLVDKMMFKGKPTSITRYSMRTNSVGPLSKATFEESIDTVVSAAIKTEVERNTGVSASIICGNQPKIGTGYMGIHIDFDGLKEVVEEVASQEMPPQTYY